MTDEKKKPDEVTEEELEDVAGGVSALNAPDENQTPSTAPDDIGKTPAAPDPEPVPYPIKLPKLEVEK